MGRLRRRPVRGAAASLAIHLLVVVLAVWVGAPSRPIFVKRGEPLFIELPETPDPAPPGNPAARTVGPPAPEPPRKPTPPQPKPTPTVSPQPVVKARPPAQVTLPAAGPVPAEPPPPATAAPVVASRPAIPEPPAPTTQEPAVQPQDQAGIPTPAGPVPDRATAEAAAPPAPAEPPANPLVDSPAPAAPPRVAAIPPPAEPAPVDIRAALGAGAGGRAQGRGGIEGEPIPLDTPDVRYSDYFERVRQMIKRQWGYPCVKNADTRECEFKTASLVVEFGIAKDGKVPFVTVVRSSGWPIYDDYAVNAIKLASPFPPVPDAVSKKGLPVLARFNYVVDTSLTNFLR